MKTLLAALLLSAPAAAHSADSSVFALNFYRQAAKNRTTNIMVSPYSLRQVLGIAYVGAAKETRAQMAKVLGAGSAFAREEKGLRRSLNEAEGPVTLRAANALWLMKDYVFLTSFPKEVKESFDAEVFVRPFDDAAKREINAWAADKTSGKIPTIVDELKKDDRAVLLNAVYFKGDWKDAFNKGTRRDTFHPTVGEPFELVLMNKSRAFGYAESEARQAVRLPYKGGRLAMVVVLPAKGTSLAELRAGLNAPAWAALRAGLAQRAGIVAMPNFTFETSISPISELTAMGMPLPFDRWKANFSNMARPPKPEDELYISDVQQKTFVAVDEKGTEAAAVTKGTMSVRGAALNEGPEPFFFVADRPFMFVIEDMQTGTILFIGEVHDPR